MSQQPIEPALSDGAASPGSPVAVADATADALRSLFAELEPLIGAQGARALYLRSLHLTPSFKRPAPPQPVALSEHLMDLHRDLAARRPDEVQDAAATLLHALTTLLVSLLGNPLTNHLLCAAWGSPLAEQPTQEKPL
ncbi:MAG: hypothetical protein WKG52_02675 [Variovorax sp.]